MYESLGVLSSLRVASLSSREGLNRLNIYKYMHISYCIFGIYNVNSFTSSLCNTECMLPSLKPKVKFSVNFFYETSKSKPIFLNDLGGTIHIKTRLRSNKANAPFSLSCLSYGQHPNYFFAISSNTAARDTGGAHFTYIKSDKFLYVLSEPITALGSFPDTHTNHSTMLKLLSYFCELLITINF